MSFGEYLDYMAEDNTWGDGVMMAVASRLYDCSISMLTDSGGSSGNQKFASIEINDPDVNKNKPNLIIGFMAFGVGSNDSDNDVPAAVKDHYVSLVPISSRSRQHASSGTSREEHLSNTTSSSHEPEDASRSRQPASSGTSREEHLSHDTGKSHHDLTVKCQPFPVKPFKQGGRDHNFIKQWYVNYPWLHYESDDVGVVCFECKNALNRGLVTVLHKETAFTTTGCLNWKKAKGKFMDHMKSEMHREAVLKNSLVRGIPITAQLSNSITQQQSAAKVALKAMFTSMKYLAKQGLSIRGHAHDDGNFMELLALRAEDIPQLKVWLSKSKTMSGWKMQNEMLQIMGKAVLRKILAEVRERKEFALIVDETTDCSTKEQVSITVRSVSKDFDITESFLGLYETASTTSQSLTDIIKDTLVRCSLSLSDLRGQCYDGASNMKGIHNGVQARIGELQPLALYVHCCNHSLNLALQDTARDVPLVRNALQYVHDTAKVLKTSKRKSEFLDIVQEMDDVPCMTPKTLCPTRWTVRAAAILSILATYPAVLEMLERLGASGTDIASTAAGLFAQLEKSDVYLSLLIARDIFVPTEKLSLVLEGESQTVSGACAAAKLTLAHLGGLRNEEHFAELWKEMYVAEEKYDLVSPQLPRFRRIPKRFEQTENPGDPYTFQTPQDLLRKQFYEVVDKVTTEMRQRFLQPGMQTLEAMESVYVQPIVDWKRNEETTEALQKYGFNTEELAMEMSIFTRLFSSKIVSVDQVVERLKTVPEESRMLFPLALKLLKLLLVVPATSATAERSFSTMKRIKSYLRSTMGQERLNDLCLLSVYKAEVEALDVDELADEFAGATPYRMQVFGR